LAARLPVSLHPPSPVMSLPERPSDLPPQDVALAPPPVSEPYWSEPSPALQRSSAVQSDVPALRLVQKELRLGATLHLLAHPSEPQELAK
jgi:hypothetical protein